MVLEWWEIKIDIPIVGVIFYILLIIITIALFGLAEYQSRLEVQ